MSHKRVYLHPLTERIWHWIHALAVVMLAITGVQLHWPGSIHWFGSLKTAMSIHEFFGATLVLDFLLWLFYNLFSGRIKHYIPTMFDLTKGAVIQAKFYGLGIFQGKPHPFAPTEDNKFNPLQKTSYFGLMAFLVPLLLASGILYMFPVRFAGIIKAIGGMTVLGLAHTAIAFIVVAFVTVHLYLTTTGHTLFEEIMTMITGWKETEED